jgi:hypothetical protein
MNDGPRQVTRVSLPELPSDVGALSRAVQGLLVHSEWLTAYGLGEADFRTVSPNTLLVADHLHATLNASIGLVDGGRQ